MTNNDVPAAISAWFGGLAPVSIEEIAPKPGRAAVFSADMINGFVHEGPLASPNVHALVEPVTSLFSIAWESGVRQFVLLQDTHNPDTPEFRAYPPHCKQDSIESDTIPELESLPFAEAFTIIRKNSLNPAIDTGFTAWLEANPELETAIVVGDCTDLCTYQLAMHLRMWANARNLQQFEVVVPANAVATFDVPDAGPNGGGFAHPAEFFHQVFLYHMALNGIRIVSAISAA